jgi:hypothetical protein
MMATLFAIFYVDDTHVAARDPVFLQNAINVLVDTFEFVGLETNIAKTRAMICTPGRIRVQLLSKSYRWMRTGCVTATEWEACIVTCRECGKQMRHSSLGRYLVDVRDIYQQAVVAGDLLEERESNTYVADGSYSGKNFTCPFPGCLGVLNSGWMSNVTSVVSIPRTLSNYNTRVFIPVANSAGCSATRPTRRTSTPRNSVPGPNGGISGTWQFDPPLRFVNSSLFTTKCSCGSMSSSTSGVFFPKTMMMSRQFVRRFAKPVPPKRESAMYSEHRRPPHESAPSSMWQWSNRCSSTAARRGCSARRQWQGWRGFIFGRRTRWQRNMCLSAGRIGSGHTQSQRMF